MEFFVARHRYAYMGIPGNFSLDVFKRTFGMFRDACAAEGYEADPLQAGWLVPIYVADTDEKAHAEARPAKSGCTAKGLKQTPEMVTPPGYMSPGSLRGVLSSGMRPFGGASYEDLLAQGQAVVGSPASVADRLGSLYAELGGFGQLIGLFAIGPSTHEQVMRSAELFATEVMPVLRPLGVMTANPQASA